MSHPALQVNHSEPYATISPSRPELSQKGRTVLITGGNSGIGFAIARSFTKATAKQVIIVGRRADRTDAAVEDLSREATALKSPTKIIGRVCDISNLKSVEELWQYFTNEGIFIDVLVLNAAAGGAVAPILQSGRDAAWADFETNVRSTLDLTERFYKQTDTNASQKKFLVNLSSTASYMWSTMAPERPTYGLTKNVSTLLLQQIAKDTRVEDMQIVSFHPGGVLTDMARKAGYDENSGIPFDHEDLPGHFAVWAASDQAQHLHGRFVWAGWDVDEVRSTLGSQLLEPGHFLKIGIEGLSESGPNSLFEKMAEIQRNKEAESN